MSARTEAFEEIMDFLNDPKNGLCEVYGCIEGISKDKKYRYTTFCRARYLDGEVRVYSPSYILVRWRGHSVAGDDDTWIFGSTQDAIDFMRLNFVEHDEAALDVPMRGER